MLCFIACSKESINSTPPGGQSVNLELVAEVENLPRSLVALGHASLNSAEKVVFWRNHVDRYLKSHANLSPALVEHIKKLRAFAKADIWDKNAQPEMRQYITDFEQNWLIKPAANGTFPAKVLVEVATLRGAGRLEQTATFQKNSGSITYNPPADANCTCRYSIYCFTTSCNDKPECAPGEPNNPGDCGVFGTSRCTGRCE